MWRPTKIGVSYLTISWATSSISSPTRKSVFSVMNSRRSSSRSTSRRMASPLWRPLLKLEENCYHTSTSSVPKKKADKVFSHYFMLKFSWILTTSFSGKKQNHLQVFHWYVFNGSINKKICCIYYLKRS